jgi:hypothetical protein
MPTSVSKLNEKAEKRINKIFSWNGKVFTAFPCMFIAVPDLRRGVRALPAAIELEDGLVALCMKMGMDEVRHRKPGTFGFGIELGMNLVARRAA